MDQLKEQQGNATVSDEEVQAVMADFLEMGHVENIVSMFKQDAQYYDWTGELLKDQRFAVRLGVSVLFEYLLEECPDDVGLAVPSLVKQLTHPTSWIRGEVVNVLGIIGTKEAMVHVGKMVNDPDAQVAEVARDILQEAG